MARSTPDKKEDRRVDTGRIVGRPGTSKTAVVKGAIERHISRKDSDGVTIQMIDTGSCMVVLSGHASVSVNVSSEAAQELTVNSDDADFFNAFLPHKAVKLSGK